MNLMLILWVKKILSLEQKKTKESNNYIWAWSKNLLALTKIVFFAEIVKIDLTETDFDFIYNFSMVHSSIVGVISAE